MTIDLIDFQLLFHSNFKLFKSLRCSVLISAAFTEMQFGRKVVDLHAMLQSPPVEAPVVLEPVPLLFTN